MKLFAGDGEIGVDVVVVHLEVVVVDVGEFFEEEGELDACCCARGGWRKLVREQVVWSGYAKAYAGNSLRCSSRIAGLKIGAGRISAMLQCEEAHCVHTLILWWTILGVGYVCRIDDS